MSACQHSSSSQRVGSLSLVSVEAEAMLIQPRRRRSGGMLQGRARRQFFNLIYFEGGVLGRSPSFSICFGTSFTKPSATFLADFGLNDSLVPVQTKSPSGLLVA